jgi:hypothetical protein
VGLLWSFVGLLVSLGFFIGQFLALASTQCNIVAPFWVFLFFIFIYIHFYLSKKKNFVCSGSQIIIIIFFLVCMEWRGREVAGSSIMIVSKACCQLVKVYWIVGLSIGR